MNPTQAIYPRGALGKSCSVTAPNVCLSRMAEGGEDYFSHGDSGISLSLDFDFDFDETWDDGRQPHHTPLNQ